MGPTVIAVGQSTPTSGVGPDELVDFAPIVVRTGWFLLGAAVVVLLGRYAVEPALSRVVRRRNRDNPTIQEAFTRYLRVFVLVMAVFVGAGIAGYGRFLGNSAVVVAAATLAVGVAGQTVVGSLISGLVLVFDPEFSVGNYIEWDGGEGTVRSITVRVTRVETPDGALVTIPNTVLTDQAITKPFGRESHRVVDRVGIDYGDDVETALGLLEDAARGLDGVAADPEPVGYVDDLGDDAVVLRVEYWLDRPRPAEVAGVRSEFARAVKARFEEAGITVSPPPEHDLRGRIAVEDGG